jgi:hypothetical protein
MEKIYRRPRLNILIILGITLFFAVQLPRTTLDNDVFNFVPKNHPETEAYQRTTDLFGSSMILGVGLEFPGESIFSPEPLELIRELTAEFEGFDHVESVMSLTNTDFIEGTPEGMKVSPLIGEDFGAGPQETLELKKKLADWQIYRSTLYSEDLSSTQILITFEDELEADPRAELYYRIEGALDAKKDIPFNSYLAGNPAIAVVITDNMKGDMLTLIPMVVLVVLIALFISFRRPGGALIAIITVILSTVWTMGAMALLKIPLSMVATVIPVLMVAVGSAYGIHIISHYYDEIDQCREKPSPEEHRRIIFHTMEKVGRPVFLAGLTTIAGFGALATSQVIPMKFFGIFTAFGVFAAVIVALVFIPSLLLLRGRGLKGPAKSPDRIDGEEARQGLRKYPFLLGTYHFFSTRKVRVLLLAVAIAAIGVYGSSLVIRDNALIEYFKPDTTIRRADRFLREKFAGTEFFDIVVRGREKGDLANPEILQAMDNLAVHLEQDFKEVSRVNSFADFIKRMNQVMNYPPLPAEAGIDAGAGIDSSRAEQDSTTTEDTSPPAADTGFSSFFSDDGDAEDSGSGFNYGFNDGFEGGFSVQADTSQSGEYTDSFGGGFSTEDSGNDADSSWGFFEEDDGNTNPGTGPATGLKDPLQPIDFSRTFTYGDFVILLNEIYADLPRGEMSTDAFVEEINRRMNYRGSAFYEIPYDPAKYPAENREGLKNLISQYLLLYSGSMEDWADDALEPRQVRMTVQLNTTGSRATLPVLREVKDYTDRYFPEGYEVEMSGSALIKNAITDLLIDAQTLSILISLSLVFLIVSLNFRSLIAGLFGIVPMSFAIIINFAVMGFFGIKLDISTAMVASVAIGIGIDYTIHFMSNYHYERQRSDDIDQVTLNTLRTTGKAIIFNAFAVAAGFSVLIFSNFNPLMYTGMLIALTMFTSSLAAMTLLPVLLNIFTPNFIKKPLTRLSNGG